MRPLLVGATLRDTRRLFFCWCRLRRVGATAGEGVGVGEGEGKHAHALTRNW